MKKLLFVAIAAALFSSCKKEIYGCVDYTAQNYSTAATIDDGSCIESQTFEIGKEYEYSLDFSSTKNYDSFTIDNYEEGDLVVTYVLWDNLSGTFFWSAIPLQVDGIVVLEEITDSGLLFITLGSPNNINTYPFSGSTTQLFKTIHIKSKFTSGIALEDLNNYETARQYIIK